MQDIVYKLVPGLQESESDTALFSVTESASPNIRSELVRVVFLSDFFKNYYCFLLLDKTGEDKRIKEFYQSRGLERVIQPAGDGKSLPLLQLT